MVRKVYLILLKDDIIVIIWLNDWCLWKKRP